MTDMEMDLVMAQAEVLTLRKTVKEYEITIANQKNHIASLQKVIEDLRKQREPAVKHGRWVRTDDTEFVLGDFECSVCEHLECDIDTTCLTPGGNCLYFCPNCGSKMDGENNG